MLRKWILAGLLATGLTATGMYGVQAAVMDAAHWGINTASRIPKMIPTRINFTKLVSLTQRQKFLIIFIPPQFNTLIIAK